MKKRILAASVCAAMVLSLTACAKSEEPVSGISSQTESSDSSKPEESSSIPEQNNSEANGSSSKPQSSNSAPESSNSAPQSSSSAPQSSSSAPQSSSSATQSSSSALQSSSSKTQSSSSKPQSSSSKPQSSSSKPQSSSSKPQSSSSKPQSSSSKPQSSSSKPQSSSSKPQSSSSKPQSSSTTTTTPTPSTTVIDWSKVPYADEFDFNYENCDGGVKITGYTGSETILKMPETINGKKVVRIGDGAFKYAGSGMDNVTDVKIPNAVTILESECFRGNARLKSINLPTGLKEIWKGAFNGCTGIKRLTIPDSVINVDKEHGKSASIVSPGLYGYIENIEFVYKGKTYAPDRYYAFHDTINYASNSYEIEYDYFDTTVLRNVSRALTTAVIPSDVKEIDTTCFDGCKDLTSVTIPEGVTSIWSSSNTSSRGFPGCEKLKSLTLPNSLTYLELKALGTERVNGIETITWKGRTYKRSQFERLCQDVCNS